jgi:type IV secretory pathway VirB4 component
LIKTLQNTLKQDREGFVLPKSVQDAIPIRRLWPDGIFQFGSKFSKTIRFSDINYAIASKEDKTSMFLGYSELLNALDTGSTTKLTINNKRLNRQDFEQRILLPRQGDYLDGYRAEYNSMLMDKVTDSSNSVVQERYITISVHRKSIEEARTFFDRVTADVSTRLSHLDARSEELDAVERLRVLHDFYRTGKESEYRLDLRDLMRKGHSFKDTICPDSLEFKKDYFVMGDKVGRVLFLKEYASYIKDSMVGELTALNRTMMLSIDVIPVPTDEAVREMQNRLLGVETNVTNWQRRQNNNNNFSAVVPYDLEQQRKETREMLDDLTTRDQRMMFAVVTLVHLADSKEELDSDTDALQSAARKHLCQLSTLNWQQADGLVTVLPLGLRRIDALRTLTTEALAVLMPFKAQEVRDQGGVYYGQNVISKNLIIANRKELLNGNGFVLGVSGSGKSFTAKREMVNLALSTDDDIIVIDPESEYRPLIEGLGGEVISISATSPNHINAMDMEQGYGDSENPVVLKSEFLLSLCEQLMGDRLLSAKEKSIIDRCTANVYHSYIKGGYQGKAPTLQDFHAELLCQSEPEARDVALAIELFTEGSLNTFAKPTNVDTDAKILCYDIRDLGKQLLPVGMLVVLDSVFNRIIRNRQMGRNTWVYIDEIYLLFQHEYSANFLFTLWKRVRKYGACCTGLTQNVDVRPDRVLCKAA